MKTKELRVLMHNSGLLEALGCDMEPEEMTEVIERFADMLVSDCIRAVVLEGERIYTEQGGEDAEEIDPVALALMDVARDLQQKYEVDIWT
jgi:hypothetical protein